MRATTTLAGTSLTLVLAGCSSGVPLASIPAECMPSESIAIEYTRGRRIEVSNECIRVTAGRTIEITFSPVPPLNEVRTKYTGLGNRWLDRKNSDAANPGRIVMPVPPDAGVDPDERDGDLEGIEYKYDIVIKGLGRLDPRIVVQ